MEKTCPHDNTILVSEATNPPSMRCPMCEKRFIEVPAKPEVKTNPPRGMDDPARSMDNPPTRATLSAIENISKDNARLQLTQSICNALLASGSPLVENEARALLNAADKKRQETDEARMKVLVESNPPKIKWIHEKPQTGDAPYWGGHVWVEKHNVASSSDPSKIYTVSRDTEGRWGCSCPAWIYRRLECKHIRKMKAQYNPPSATKTVGDILDDAMSRWVEGMGDKEREYFLEDVKNWLQKVSGWKVRANPPEAN